MSEYEGNEEEIRREATRWNMSKHRARIHKRRRAGALLLLCADPESHLEPVPEISALPQVWRPARVSPGTPHPNFFFAPAVRKDGRMVSNVAGGLQSGMRRQRV